MTNVIVNRLGSTPPAAWIIWLGSLLPPMHGWSVSNLFT